ncbi:MAG: adenosylhomocysteinase [Anaerolineae bacterium]
MAEGHVDAAGEFEQNLAWTRRHMVLTRTQSDLFPDLTGVRLAVSAHLDIKGVAVYETLLQRGCALFLTTCNPLTVRNNVVFYLVNKGAEAHAWHGMSAADQAEAMQLVIAWQPTHLCEMGADITAAILEQRQSSPVKASLEATGSGISRINKLCAEGATLGYPIFNWDDLPIKEGLHNRYLVGLSTWHTFTERTHLSLHRKQVLVIGYGLVGQGVAESARAYGGSVSIAERDPARLLEARYAGYAVGALDDLLPRADVIVTATGARHVLNRQHFPRLKDGCFLINVGHVADEIEVEALNPRQQAIPFVEEVTVNGRTVNLFAGGSMANLVAGWGDTLNAFDVTLATMAAGLRYIFTAEAQNCPPKLHPLPRQAWEAVAAQAAQVN